MVSRDDIEAIRQALEIYERYITLSPEQQAEVRRLIQAGNRTQADWEEAFAAFKAKHGMPRRAP